jgi:NADH-quinone oxidoreductase subunit E
MIEQNLISPATLSEKIRQEIDIWVKKFPADQKQSAVMPALTIVQKEHGWLSEKLMDAVAIYLQMPKIAVYEVASFYSMYDLSPVGTHKICVCTNISCMLNGCDKITSHIKNKLDIDFNETTKDGKFTLKSVECLGACGGAPMMQIGDDYYENLSPEKVDTILAELE